MPIDAEILYILQRLRGNDLQQGRPFYSHRLSQEDESALTNDLVSMLRGNHRFTVHDDASFCLIASRIFCREHSEGTWAWETIRSRLSDERSYQELCSSVERGFWWWSRPIIQTATGRQFLASIICEGGLPLKVLKRKGYGLRNFFKRLIRDKERFPNRPVEELCRHYELDLPKTLRIDAVFALASRLVESIVKLRAEVGQEERINVQMLDQSKPGWRDEVPLDLEDDTAVSVFNILLSEPRVSAGTGRFGVDILLERNEEVDIQAVPRVPQEMPMDEFVSRFGLSSSAGVPLRFRITLEDEAARRLVSVTADKYTPLHGGEVVRFGAVPSKRTQCNENSTFTWVMLSANEVLGKSEVEGGLPHPDVPWSFVDDDGELVLRGEGRVSTRHESLVLAVPEGFQINLEEGEFHEIGSLAGFDMKLYDVRGIVTLLDAASGEPSYRIKTGAERDSISRFSLQGHRMDQSIVGREVWRGVPKVIEISDDGSRNYVKKEEIESSVPGTGRWQRGTVPACGDVTIRVRRNDKILFRRKTCVLEEGFRLKLESSQASGEGSVHLSGLDLRDIQVQTYPEQADCKVTIDGPQSVVEMDAGSCAAETVALDLGLERGAAKLVVPFPTRDAAFISPTGEKLPEQARISVGRLSGVRARAYSLDPQDRFVVVANPGNKDLGELKKLEGGVHDLVLDRLFENIEELVSVDDSPDPYSELRIELRQGLVPMNPKRLFVHQFELALEASFDGEENRVVAKASESQAFQNTLEPADNLVLQAIPIFDPNREPESLQKTDEGHWVLDASGLESGAWIVRGMMGDWLAARPTFVGVRMGERPATESPLIEAIHESPQTIVETMVSVFENIVSDNEHPDWQLINSAVLSTTLMPVDTYMICKALKKHPVALATSMLGIAGLSVFGQIWASFEKSRFLWSCVSAEAWSQAADIVLGPLLKAEEDSQVRMIADSILHGLGKVSCLGIAIEGFLRAQLSETGVKEDPGFKFLRSELGRQKTWEFRVERSDGLKQELFRANSERRWPRCRLGSLRSKLEQCGWSFEFLPSSKEKEEFKSEVLDAPVMAAGAAAWSVWLTEADVEALRKARAFDRKWFDEVQGLALAMMLAKKLGQKK